MRINTPQIYAMTLNNIANFINQINILVISVARLTTRYWCYKLHNKIDEDSSHRRIRLRA